MLQPKLSLAPPRRWLVLVGALMLALSFVYWHTLPTQAAQVCLNDSAGANDEPGQKDLTRLCYDVASLPANLPVSWNWDETSWSGNNSGDACSLFDTDGDGNANYAFCVTIKNNPAAIQTTNWYSCNDTRTDRCAGDAPVGGAYQTTCSVSIQATQPFGSGDSTPNDAVAACDIKLSDINNTSATLIDVCSYPSTQPNSDPSDCVGARAKTGKLEVRKVLNPSSDPGLFNLQIDNATVGTGANVSNGGTTGEQVVAQGNHTVGETAGTGTTLVGYTPSIVCKDLNGTGTTLASSSTSGPLTVAVADGADVVCTITNTKLAAAIGIDKTATQSVINPGGSVTYNYAVTNQAQAPLSSVSVSDDKCSPVNPVLNGSFNTGDSDQDGFLETGETWQFTCTTTLTVDTTNIATARGNPPVGNPVTATDSAFVDVRPTITVAKSANPTSVPESGGLVAFTVVVNNTSGEAVTLNTLNDSIFGNLHNQGTCSVPQPIISGGNYSCTFSQLISGDFPGSHVNLVTASATDNEGNSASASDDATVTYTDVLPAVRLEKSVTPASRTEPGGAFNYTLTIYNDATETATITALSDTYTLSAQCQNLVGTTIPAGSSVSCQYTVNQTQPGVYPNTANVTLSDNDNNSASDSDNESVTVIDSPSSLVMSKTANPTSLPEPGGSVQYTVRITNTSAVDTITLNTITDDTNNDNTVDVTYQAAVICNPTVLAPGQVAVCTFSHNVTGNAGALFTDVAKVNATDDDGKSVTGSDDATVTLTGVGAQILVSKTPNPASLPEPGGSVVFTVRITNTSTIDVVTINNLNDSVFGNVTTTGHNGITATTCTVSQNLAANGGVYQCTFTAQVTGNFGQKHTNTVSASGVDDDGESVGGSGSAEVPFTNTPSALTVNKSANPTSVPESGGNVAYTVVVANSSAVDSITLNNVIDDRFGDVSSSCQPALPTLLAPNASVTCTFSRFVQGNANTTHTNVATASGVDDDNQPVSGSDSETVTFTNTPAVLTVEKSGTPASVPESGGTVLYQVVVTNTSVVDVITVNQVVDDKFGNISSSCTPALPVALDPKESITCLFTGSIQGNAGASHTNTATASGTDDDGNPVSGKDDLTIPFTNLPSSASLSKTADTNSVPKDGGVVVFAVRIENTSVADSITFTELTDSVFGNVAAANNPALVSTTCVMPQTLTAGQVYTCQFSATIQGPVGFVHNNILTAKGNDDDGNPITPTDDETVTVAAPVISATKRDALLTDADQNGVVSPGDTLEYTIVIRNTGNVAGTATFLNDALDPNVTLVIGSIVASQGTVTAGNNAGDSSVAVSLGDIQPDGNVTIRFQVQINNPLPQGVTQVANQALVRGNNFPTLPTDDPDTPTPDDPTVTPLTAAPLISAVKSDSLAVDADGNGVVSPGDTLEYRIAINNNGNQAATTTFVNDPIDNNVALIIGSVLTTHGTVVKGNTAGDTEIQVNVGTIAGGQSVLITFRVRINNPLPTGVNKVSNQGFVSGGNFPSTPTDDPDTPTDADPTDTPVTAAPALDATKRVTLDKDADGNGTPSPGDTLLYQVTIINSGNTAATNVVFVDSPDANTSLVVGSVQTSQGLVIEGNDPGNNAINIQIGTIPGQGGEVTISFSVVINNPLPATVIQIKNQGFVTSQQLPTVPTDDPTTPPTDDPTATVARAVPLLTASKRVNLLLDADNDGIAEPGDTLRYEVTLANVGNAPLTNVVFSDTLDANVSLVANSLQSSLGTILSGSNATDREVRVNIGTLVSGGGQAVITYLVRINSPLPAGVTEIRNQGVVTSQELPDLPTDDPVPPGGSDPTVTPVIGAARLQMIKRDTLWVDADDNQKVNLNDILLYEIRISNVGNTVARSVVFQDTPDAKTSLVNGTVRTTQGDVVAGNNNGDSQLAINIGDIPAGATVNISFQVRIIVNTTGVVNNQAQIGYVDSGQPTGVGVNTPSDDPDTPGKADDPTTTVLDGPTALEESAEPTNPAWTTRVFMPAIRR